MQKTFFSFIKPVALSFSLFLTSLTVPAQAEDLQTIEISIKNHVFEPATITVPTNKPFMLLVKNLDSTPEEIESHSMKIEKVIQGNTEAKIRVRPLKKGSYKFFGEFNEKTAQGVINAE